MNTDDPYGRQTAHDAAVDWQQREAQQMREKAYAAARNIAEGEARLAAEVDPETVDAWDAEVERRTQELLDVIVKHTRPNPLAPYLIDWPEFWATEHEEQEWLLEPLFAKGRSHALYAGAKTGKSYLVLAACAALATGRGFLAEHEGEPVHVLYLDYEMSPQDIRERLEEFGYGPDDDLSHLHYALLPSLPPLDTDAGGQALLDGAMALKVEFVIVDTTSRAIEGDENDADTIRAFYRHTGLRLKQNGIGWMRLDHAGKDVDRGQRGSSAKNDDVDVVARVERTDQGQRWIATHRRMSWYPELVEIVVAAGSDGVTRFATSHGHSWPAGTADLAKELDRLEVPVEASRKLARWYMDQAGVKGQNKVLGPALKWRRMEAQRVADEALDELSERLVAKADRPADRVIHRQMDGGPDIGGPETKTPPLQRTGAADRCGPASAANADRGPSPVGDGHGPAGPDRPPEDVVGAPDDPDEELF